MRASLEKSEAKAAMAKKRMEAENNTEDWIKVVPLKTIEAFRALEELHEEKIQFASNAYDARK